MKIIHIESGIGNQMLSYCEYIALQKTNLNDKCYIETIIYEIPECNNIISQWNGYELDKVFGLNTPNIKSLFSDEKWGKIINEIYQSQFWERNWNYPVYFSQTFNKNGWNIINYRGDFEEKAFLRKSTINERSIKYKIRNSVLYQIGKRYYHKVAYNHLLYKLDNSDKLFVSTEENIFTGQRLSFKFHCNNIEKIDDEIRKTFRFPTIVDDKNNDMMRVILSSNSVAIHARRGDMLSVNGYCYKNGYFRRAVRYIKNHVENPVFIFFCDPGSIQWCKENEHIFGLNFKKDTVYFVDWNKGDESFRDMQLMAKCKHNIITNSSFGWWGAYLNENKNKITCSPDYRINTTHWF